MNHRKEAWEVMQFGEFRTYIIGRFIFILSLRMMSTLVGWWLYELTGDPLAMGLIGLAEVIPAVSLALYAGHVVDLSDRRKVLVRSILLYTLVACLLLALSMNLFPTAKTPWGIYAAIFITGIIRAFSGPAFGAILSQLIPREKLANATAWSQSSWLTASVCGHALGGFLIAGIGVTNTLFTICILLVVAFSLIRTIAPKPSPNKNAEQPTFESVKEGLRFVFKTKEVLGALSLDLFAVLFGGAVAMVPVFAKDVLKVGPIGYGWLNGAADIGAILSVVYLTLSPLQKHQGRTLLIAVGGFGLCIITFGLSQLFWLSFAALLISGILDGISIVIRGTILQLKTPNELRGRVMSVNSMFINSSNELGQFESGLAARLMGLVPSVVFGGSMTILVVLTTWFKAPSLRKLTY